MQASGKGGEVLKIKASQKTYLNEKVFIRTPKSLTLEMKRKYMTANVKSFSRHVRIQNGCEFCK